jgi:hypothetical protein
MEIFKLLNLSVRFLLELCILVIVGYWGFHTEGTGMIKTLLGIGSVLAFAVMWGMFLAPKSSMRLQGLWALSLEVLVFGLTAWTLYSTRKRSLTMVFGAIYLLNKILMVIWRQ